MTCIARMTLSVESSAHLCYSILNVVLQICASSSLVFGICLQITERMQYPLFVLRIFGLQAKTKTDTERFLLILLYTSSQRRSRKITAFKLRHLINCERKCDSATDAELWYTIYFYLLSKIKLHVALLCSTSHNL